MAADKFISYYSYYISAFMFGLFFRRFAVPSLLIVVLWHYMIYGIIVGPERFSESDFHYWLPLTALTGVVMGYMLSCLMNFRRLIFWKAFDLYGCWLPTVLLEFIVMHGVLVVWETTGTFVRPVNFIVTFIAFAILIPLWYFFTCGFTIWGYWDDAKQKLSYDDRAAIKFYCYWALFHLSATLIFTVVEWANSEIWPFWIALGVFVFHSVLWFMISLFIINASTSGADFQYKKIRAKVVQQLQGGDKSAFSWPWSGNSSNNSDKSRNSSDAIEMEMTESRKSLLKPPKQTTSKKGKEEEV